MFLSVTFAIVSWLHQAQRSLIAQFATVRTRDSHITAGLHTAAPQAMRMGIPPLFSVAGNKKWSMPRAQEYREMLLILLQTSTLFARLKYLKRLSSPPWLDTHPLYLLPSLRILDSGLTLLTPCGILLFARRKTNIAG